MEPKLPDFKLKLVAGPICNPTTSTFPRVYRNSGNFQPWLLAFQLLFNASVRHFEFFKFDLRSAYAISFPASSVYQRPAREYIAWLYSTIKAHSVPLQLALLLLFKCITLTLKISEILCLKKVLLVFSGPKEDLSVWTKKLDSLSPLGACRYKWRKKNCSIISYSFPQKKVRLASFTLALSLQSILLLN